LLKAVLWENSPGNPPGRCRGDPGKRQGCPGVAGRRGGVTCDTPLPPQRKGAEETPGRSRVLRGGPTGTPHTPPRPPQREGAQDTPGRSGVLKEGTQGSPKGKAQKRLQEGAGC